MLKKPAAKHHKVPSEEGTASTSSSSSSSSSEKASSHSPAPTNPDANSESEAQESAEEEPAEDDPVQEEPSQQEQIHNVTTDKKQQEQAQECQEAPRQPSTKQNLSDSWMLWTCAQRCDHNFLGIYVALMLQGWIQSNGLAVVHS